MAFKKFVSIFVFISVLKLELKATGNSRIPRAAHNKYIMSIALDSANTCTQYDKVAEILCK